MAAWPRGRVEWTASEATFNYPVLARANARITVLGATLSGLRLRSVAVGPQLHEGYSTYLQQDFGPGTTTVVASMPMVPNAAVTYYGTAFLTMHRASGSSVPRGRASA